MHFVSVMLLKAFLETHDGKGASLLCLSGQSFTGRNGSVPSKRIAIHTSHRFFDSEDVRLRQSGSTG